MTSTRLHTIAHNAGEAAAVAAQLNDPDKYARVSACVREIVERALEDEWERLIERCAKMP